MKGNPTVMRYGTEINVFSLGSDSHPYKNTFNGQSWGGWTSLGNYMDSGFGSLGGTVVGNPDVISYSGQLNIWANTAGGHIFKRTWNGSGWGNWEDFGGTLHGNPDAMQYNSDMQIFARAANGVMHKRHWSASGNYWSGWESIDSDTPVAGDPTAIQYGSELDVFATGADKKTYKKTFNPSTGWGGFTALPG